MTKFFIDKADAYKQTMDDCDKSPKSLELENVPPEMSGNVPPEMLEIVPPEMWARVLRHLPHSYLCSLALVSRHFYTVASDTSLWLDAPINTSKLEHQSLHQLLSIPRFSNIIKLDLSKLKLDKKQLKELLTTVRDTGALEDLNFTQCLKLAEVPAFLIAQSVSRLTRVNFSKTCLTTQQCTALLSNSLHSSTLQDVNLSHVNLSKVDSHLLSSAVPRFCRVDLSFTALSPDQTQLLLASIPLSPITEISLKKLNLSSVPALVLGDAVGHLTSADLGFTKLTSDQSTAVLSVTSSSPSLRDLSLWGNPLHSVAAQTVSNAALLTRVNLHQTNLTPDQCCLLLSRSLTCSRLRDLDLGHANLALVPGDLLSGAVARLDRAVLTNTKLTTSQSSEILTKCLNSSIKYIDLSFVNVTEVPLELLDQPGKTIYL